MESIIQGLIRMNENRANNLPNKPRTPREKGKSNNHHGFLGMNGRQKTFLPVTSMVLAKVISTPILHLAKLVSHCK